MADSTIPGLDPVVTPALTDLLGVRQSGDARDKKLTTAQLISLVPAGGDVTKVGTPVDDQIGVWTGDGTLEGDPNFTWDGHSLLLNHTAIESDEFGLQINTDGAGFADVKSIDINHETGAISSGDDEAIILIDIDQILAVGGDITAIKILATEGGADDMTGMLVGAGIGPIGQLSGAFQDADTILNIAVDVTVALSSGGAGNISVFVADNDTMTVGLSSTFQQIECIIDTPASGAGIDALFEFSTGIGTWTSFSPTDGTNGMRSTGIIAWELGDIPTWATGTGGEFLIRITRQRNVLTTTPILDLMRVVSATEFFWDENGDVDVNSVTLNVGSVGSPALAFGDGDSGLFESSDDILQITIGGTARFSFSGDNFQGVANDTPRLLNSASSATTPNIMPSRADPDTGIGTTTVDQLSLIAGGVQVANLTEAAGVVQLIVPQQDNAASPSIAFGDGDSGIYESSDDILRVTIGGTDRFVFNGDLFQGRLTNGPAIENTAASATNPTLISDRADLDTGIGHSAADQLSLIAGGVQVANLIEAAGIVQLVVPQQNNAGSPSIAFGDGDTGFYENNDDQIRVTIAGNNKWQWSSNQFRADVVTGAMILNNISTATFPTLIPNRSDDNTGIGGVGSDQMSLIAGGLDCINIAESGAARQVGFYVTAPISLQTGVAVTAGGIHAALVALGLITA